MIFAMDYGETLVLFYVHQINLCNNFVTMSWGYYNHYYYYYHFN